MKILLDFSDALLDYAAALNQDKDDKDVIWYLADIFELVVNATLDKDTSYKETMQSVVIKVSNETGESREYSQSAYDIATNQILNKISEVFCENNHSHLFNAKKKISRINLATYMITFY